MLTKSCLCAAWCWLLGIAACHAAYLPPDHVERTPLVTAVRTNAPPILDGDLSDACWMKACPLDGFVLHNEPVLAVRQTTAYVAYDDANLYIAFRCTEPDPGKIKAEVDRADGRVWTDDCVEVFMDPAHEHEQHYQLVVNSRGVVYDCDTGQDRWSSGAAVAASVNADSWTVELAIPFERLGAKPGPGAVWGFNLCRERYAGEVELSSWAYTHGRFLNSIRFGHLSFGNAVPTFEPHFAKPPFWGLGHVDVAVSGSSSVRMSARAGSDESLVEVGSQELSLGGAKPVAAELEYRLIRGDEELVVLELSDAGSDVCLHRHVRYVNAEPRSDIGAIRARIALFASLAERELSEEAGQDLAAVVNGAQRALAEFDAVVGKAVEEKRQVTSVEWQDVGKSVSQAAGALKKISNVLWWKSLSENFSSLEMPPDLRDLNELTIAACVDEYESAAFMVTNLHSVPFHFRIEVDDLKPTKGAADYAISNSHLTIREALFHRMRDGRVFADALPVLGGANDVVVPPGETRQVWLTVHTTDVRPGSYSGNISLIPFDHDMPRKSVKLNLSVLPIKLPAEMPIAVYQWDYALASAYVQDLLAHRTNRVLVSNNSCFPQCDDDGNVLKVDYTAHDRQLRMKRKYGTEVVYSYGVVQSFERVVAPKHGWEYLSEPWKKAFKAWLLDWISHLKDMGLDYQDFSMQIWDEATGEEADKVIQVGPFLREIDPRIRWVMDGAQNLEEARGMDRFVDIWIPHLDTLLRLEPRDRQELLDFYKSTGKPIWAYTCRTDMAGQPVLEYYRLKPWLAWKFGLDGICFWAYNSWRGDPWSDFDPDSKGYSDNGVVYSSDSGPVTSRRWEAWRDGLEDYLYLHLLREAAEQARSAGKTTDADAAEKLIEDAVKDVLSDTRDPAAVEEYRIQLANALVELSRTLSFPSPSEPRVKVEGTEASLSWCGGPCDGEVYFRIVGNAGWRKASASYPRWDSSGCTTVTLSGLHPGQTYEFYTVSIAHTGYMVVDDNGGRWYSFKAGE